MNIDKMGAEEFIKIYTRGLENYLRSKMMGPDSSPMVDFAMMAEDYANATARFVMSMDAVSMDW
jgi:hypothetical protein